MGRQPDLAGCSAYAPELLRGGVAGSIHRNLGQLVVVRPVQYLTWKVGSSMPWSMKCCSTSVCSASEALVVEGG